MFNGKYRSPLTQVKRDRDYIWKLKEMPCKVMSN